MAPLPARRMKVGVRSETAPGERRVALIPDVVATLRERGVEVVVEAGAGEGSGHPDSQYTEAGAEIGDPWGSEILVCVAVPTVEDIGRLLPGHLLIGHLAPLTSAETNKALAAGEITSFAMEAIPRITRAQAMDAPVLAGERRRLRGDAARGARGRAVLPDDDHRRGHRRAGEGPGARRRRRRACRRSRRRSGSARSSAGSTSAAPPGSRSRRSAGDRSSSTSSPTPRPRAAMRAR